MNYLITGAIALIISIGGIFGYSQIEEKPTTLGAFGDPFVSIQLATDPDADECLKTDGTNNVWDTDCGGAGGGGGGGTWSTTTSQTSGQLINYSNNTTDIVVIGSNASTTGEWWYDPNLNIGNITGKQGIGSSTPYAPLSVLGQIVASYYTATTTTASSFPYASTTQTSATGGFAIAQNGSFSSGQIYCTGTILATQIGCYRNGAPLWFYNTSTGNGMYGTGFAGGDFQIYTIPTGTTPVVAVTVEGANSAANGNVGIGNATPLSKLNVQGETSGQYFTATSTVTASTFPYASSTAYTVSGALYNTANTSALLQTDAGGLLGEYAGTSCTNQFVRSLSALGIATCATVGSADVSLANLTATDTTLTFSGTYNGATARTIGLNLGNANVWTASTTFQQQTNMQGASTTQISTNKLYAPIQAVIALSATSTMGTGTTTRKFTGYTQDWTLTEIGCTSIGTGTFMAQIGDWSASTTVVVSVAGNTTTYTTISANNSFSRGEAWYVDFGTVSGAVSQPSCSITRLTR